MPHEIRRLAVTCGTLMVGGCKPIQEKVFVACWCHQIVVNMVIGVIAVAIHDLGAGSTFPLQLVAIWRNWR